MFHLAKKANIKDTLDMQEHWVMITVGGSKECE